jgi:hypothetical protein
MRNLFIILFVLFIKIPSVTAQITNNSVVGIYFSNYPVLIENFSKATLNTESHVIGKKFKTEISRQYQENEVNFGGHFVMVFWGAGAGLSNGAMVDIKTGKIIPLPLTEDNSIRDCSFNNNVNRFYKSNSNLFVTFKCERFGEYDENSETQKIKLTFYYYTWDGAKFDLLTTKVKYDIEN